MAKVDTSKSQDDEQTIHIRIYPLCLGDVPDPRGASDIKMDELKVTVEGEKSY